MNQWGIKRLNAVFCGGLGGGLISVAKWNWSSSTQCRGSFVRRTGRQAASHVSTDAQQRQSVNADFRQRRPSSFTRSRNNRTSERRLQQRRRLLGCYHGETRASDVLLWSRPMCRRLATGDGFRVAGHCNWTSYRIICCAEPSIAIFSALQL